MKRCAKTPQTLHDPLPHSVPLGAKLSLSPITLDFPRIIYYIKYTRISRLHKGVQMKVSFGIRWFNRDEFSHPEALSHRLLYLLDEIRHEIGQPIYITSDHRPDSDTAHGTGLAIDISDNAHGNPVHSHWRHLVLEQARRLHIPRIGVYDRHIHLDIDYTRPWPRTWWGVSQ